MARAVVVVGAIAALTLVGGGATLGRPAPKIDPRVVADTSGGRQASFLVVMRAQARVGRATAATIGREAQGDAAVAALRRAAQTQTGVRSVLRRLGASYRPFWVVNGLAVRGDRHLLAALARRDDVAAIEPDREIRGLAAETVGASSSAPRGVEWGVQRIGAPELWALGFTGQGIVYANADSGVRWDAPALKRQYRGWDGTTADHAYSWWDAVHADIDGDGVNSCGFNLRAPCDDNAAGASHGTHTMGTAVGDDGAGNQVGVAPGARWIACRNMDEGVGRPSTYIECLQFFLAPTDLDGQNPDPSRRPNVVGNSYACPPDEGCSTGSLQTAVDNLRAAGVFMAVATGNEGDLGCGSVSFPPAVYDSAVSVGATDASDQIAAFSSRGPVQVDGSGRSKPDLSAPGVGTRSVTATGFGVLSGTSMAAPHVGGAVLLLWSALPQLRGNVDATEKLLQDTALRHTTSNGCGGDSATQVPNNTYGAGRIDVGAAYRAASSPASLSIADVKLAEGRSGRKPASFAVMLSRSTTQQVTVSFASRGRTARPGSDFVAVTGTLTFPAGETAQTIAVPVLGDRRVEPDETFAVVLSAPQNAALRRATGIGTIRNDDVDRTRPSLTGLAVRPAPVPVGRLARLSFRLSEQARVTCAVERATASGWQRAASVDFQVPAGARAVRLPTAALAVGRYRARCVPTDLAGNVGHRAVAPFRVS